MKMIAGFCAIITSILWISCDSEVDITKSYYSLEDYEILQKHLNLPEDPYNYDIKYPDYITTNVRTQMNYDEATLGRVLFYDKNLSADKSVSCGSCHKQELAFSDDVAFSQGVESRVTQRNSIALGSVINFNLYYGSHVFGSIPFFWDNSAMTLQHQSKRTLANPNEMNMHMSDVVARVNELPYYKPLIKKAFGTTEEANEEQILNALAEFVNSITNYNTKFDEAVSSHFRKNRNTQIAGLILPELTPEENEGKDFYLSNCASCHGTVAGRPGQTAANNGLYTHYQDVGAGMQGRAAFKVPTLRNVLRTAPYMHDGSMATIDEVLEHYSQGIKDNPGLSAFLKAPDGKAMKMNMSQRQKENLKAFLATLNDDQIVSDDRFSDPFR
jgi:cytochrome c peroxidase